MNGKWEDSLRSKHQNRFLSVCKSILKLIRKAQPVRGDYRMQPPSCSFGHGTALSTHNSGKRDVFGLESELVELL